MGALLCTLSLPLGGELQPHTIIPHAGKDVVDQGHCNNPPEAPAPKLHASLALRKSNVQKNQRHTYAKTKKVINHIIKEFLIFNGNFS